MQSRNTSATSLKMSVTFGNTVNENGKRLLDVDEHQVRNHKEAKSWHDETENSIKETGEMKSNARAYVSIPKRY